MKRSLVALLSFSAALLAAEPVYAYCVVNQSPMRLMVTLRTSSPLGEFRSRVSPGYRTCCDWFDRRCNPTARREGVVMLVIESQKRKKKTPLPGLDTNTPPVPTYDRFGNPDPYGLYDRDGLPNPLGRRAAPARPVVPGDSVMSRLPDASPSDKAHFCVVGRMRWVPVSGDGTVTVTTDSLSPGGLRCESRDHFLRPIRPPSQSGTFGVPLLGVPVQEPKATDRKPEGQ